MPGSTGVCWADKVSGHYINPRLRYSATEHTDVVKAIGSVDSRVYSGRLVYHDVLLLFVFWN